MVTILNGSYPEFSTEVQHPSQPPTRGCVWACDEVRDKASAEEEAQHHFQRRGGVSASPCFQASPTSSRKWKRGRPRNEASEIFVEKVSCTVFIAYTKPHSQAFCDSLGMRLWLCCNGFGFWFSIVYYTLYTTDTRVYISLTYTHTHTCFPFPLPVWTTVVPLVSSSSSSPGKSSTPTMACLSTLPTTPTPSRLVPPPPSSRTTLTGSDLLAASLP